MRKTVSAFLPALPPTKVIHFTPYYSCHDSRFFTRYLSLSLFPVAFRIHSFSIRITIIIYTWVPRATERRWRADDELTTVNARDGGPQYEGRGAPGSDVGRAHVGRRLVQSDRRPDAAVGWCRRLSARRGSLQVCVRTGASHKNRRRHTVAESRFPNATPAPSNMVTSHALVPRIA